MSEMPSEDEINENSQELSDAANELARFCVRRIPGEPAEVIDIDELNKALDRDRKAMDERKNLRQRIFAAMENKSQYKCFHSPA